MSDFLTSSYTFSSIFTSSYHAPGQSEGGALRAMSAALTRRANALDTPDGLERDVRMIDRV